VPDTSIPPRHDRPGAPNGAPGFSIPAAALLAALALALAAARQAPSVLDPSDAVRLAEAWRLADRLAKHLWAGWDGVPFAVLLVTPERELLIGHPRPGADFTGHGRDPLLDSEVFSRPRQFGTDLLATFPAVGGLPTIVVGRAESTAARTSTPWVATLLHEHFHQMQMSQPDYWSQVEALNLSGGDTSGQWMLDYPFPYEASAPGAALQELGRRLAEAIRAGDRDLDTCADAYRRSRERFRLALSEPDYRYFAFQSWQEGIARYTEYRMADLAAREYRPSRRFREFPDVSLWGDVASALRKDILGALDDLRPTERRRVAFYAVGAGEGLLLDRLDSDWRSRYFAHPFDLGPLLAP